MLQQLSARRDVAARGVDSRFIHVSEHRKLHSFGRELEEIVLSSKCGVDPALHEHEQAPVRFTDTGREKSDVFARGQAQLRKQSLQRKIGACADPARADNFTF